MSAPLWCILYALCLIRIISVRAFSALTHLSFLLWVAGPPSPTSNSKKSVVAGAVAAGTVGALGSTLIGLWLCIVLKRRSKERLESVHKVEKPDETGSTLRRFTYAECALSTDNFSSDRALGSGSFGVVYKCRLSNLKEPVAVKKISSVTERAVSDYSREIDIVSQLNHSNLVRLLGSCNEPGELLLVYELIENRSLEDHLHNPIASDGGTPKILNWDRRYKIALGIAEALRYLHQNFVVHRDIKPSNVFLDADFNAKVGDFGLVTQLDRDRTSQTMSISGCINYMDPEYESTGKAGPASDVYSFGLVLLEMASGMKPTATPSSSSNQAAVLFPSSLADWIRAALRSNRMEDVVDRQLNGRFNKEQMKLVLRVGLQCVQFDHHRRPTSRQVVNFLSGNDHVPTDDFTNMRVRVYVPKEFTYEELSTATSQFSHSHRLGQGAYGAVYKGMLHDNLGEWSVAVKKSLRIDSETTADYLTEIEVISQLRHQNLLRLMGWCHDQGERILVYELMENGCLSDHLSSRNVTDVNHQSLDWTKRYNIIVGIASALRYLHYEDSSKTKSVLHRDIKPSNVLLDDKFEPKLGDFGLVRQIDFNLSPQTITVGGTYAYLDPEYYRTKKASPASDVYSFGVVVLQMVLGKKPEANTTQDNQLRNLLVEEAQNLYSSQRLLAAVDKRLNGMFDERQMQRAILVALRCVQADPKERPTSSQVVHYLTDLDDLRPAANVTAGVNDGSVPAGPAPPGPGISRQQSDQYSTCRQIL